MGSYGDEASPGIFYYMECVYIVRSHRGEVSHRDYFFTEYEFSVGSHGGENSPGIFLRNIYTSCVVTG